MFDLQRFAKPPWGFMVAADKDKLDGITVGAQPNTIETVKVNNIALTPTDKAVNIDLSSYVKAADVGSALIYKGSVNSFTNLPTTGLKIGHVYNIQTAGGEDVNGTAVKAGDNVAYNGTGWDVLAGTQDLSNYVQKDGAKVLSTNDYTTAEKEKLAAISEGAQQNVIEAVSINGTSQKISNKTVTLDLSDYQPKVSGKTLSTNDYTTAEKDKLAAIPSDAQKNVIETVKVNNTALTPTDKAVNIDLSGYQPKVAGKTLTTNDYTTTEKDKLAAIAAGAQQNVIETIKVNNTALTPTNKAVNIDLSNYQQKEAGKTLTSNDYTTEEKNKLAGIAAGAEKNRIKAINLGTLENDGIEAHVILQDVPVDDNGTAYLDIYENYVQRDGNKQLSTNDYTTEEKNKLAAIPATDTILTKTEASTTYAKATESNERFVAKVQELANGLAFYSYDGTLIYFLPVLEAAMENPDPIVPGTDDPIDTPITVTP